MQALQHARQTRAFTHGRAPLKVLLCTARQTSARVSEDIRGTKLTRHEPSAEASPTPLLITAIAVGALAWTWQEPAHAASLSDAAQVVTSFASDTSGPVGVAAFITAYVAATVLFIPGSLLTLAAGAIYGPVAGTAVVSCASTLGATAAFLVARTAARPWVEDKLKGSPQVKAVLSGIGKEGARLVFLLRLSPLVPFTLLNYALGLTEVRLVEYTLASWIGMLPGTFAYVYLGGAGKAAVDAVSDGSGVGQDPTQILLWSVGAAATLLATKLASDAASRELSKLSPEDNNA